MIIHIDIFIIIYIALYSAAGFFSIEISPRFYHLYTLVINNVS